MSGNELDSLFGGESECIEYKVARPKDAKKYLKTVVAFANGHGGRIVFGVDDVTREIVGVPPEDVFEEMDALANAIGDSCEPTIYPSIYVREAEGKSLVVVEVSPGKRVPYYLRSLGLERGVYTRVGATSRPADLEYVREIMVENSPQGFDRMPNRDVELTEEGIKVLCNRMSDEALKNSRNEEERKAVKAVTVQQLIKWGVLLKRDGELVPTNAYSLLTGEGADFTWKVQCGVFRGEGRSVFLDRREFGGSVIDQVESAYQYVLSKINMGANFDQLVRRDEYEIPMWPIRELITNAILHRSYLAASCVQVCLYDDRLEISSPGGLKRGLLLEDALSGQSDIRNKALAQAFQYLKLIENWGTGLLRVQSEVTEFGLRPPEFVVSDSMFRVNIYRMSLSEFGEKLHPTRGEYIEDARTQQRNTDTQIQQDSADGTPISTDETPMDPDMHRWDTDGLNLTKRERDIISLFGRDAAITTADVANLLGLGMDRSKEIVRGLVERGVLMKHGNGRYTHYTLVGSE